MTSIKRDGREIISIVLGCDTRKQRTRESVQLINYGYANFKEIDLYEKMKKKFNIAVEKAKVQNYEITIYGSKTTIIPKGEEEKITYEYQIFNNLVAPVENNEEIGEIRIRLGNENLDVIKIKLPERIERKNIFEYFSEILKNQRKFIELKI